ncbi:Dos2-interacting transcription regulator of RNA-Pol-II-domain-containing protein [Kockovaella imperatae]|uniref:MMS19 nucleotide excision repair protein n=1 Tax=Kockovaella imperatae TaxID=4999 RepID=A0A1Y1UJ33_9TREE|nr:Dos2-interacting transcription regulator of RNA-Pol-II-domain-containing protein [Kockovaella imperatae]ORX37979.1 Dos2-interacting transcription regulator of RNA-Pol-II-domain-containing protein [Kockovaella imperatae]
MTSQDVDRICRTHVSTGDLDPPADLLLALNDGSIILSSVVKALGEFLTSEENAVRLKGLTFLSNIVKQMSPGKINRAATQTLTNFYTSKLDEFDALVPTLETLIVLSKLPTFDDETAITVYKAISEQLNMKAYVQAVRHAVYSVLDSLIALHRKALKNLGAEFLENYVKLVDGEKDPRNLMMLFAMDRVILLEFDVEPMIEEFFDITFCYFPISFRPPPNDPYGITADDLKLSLRRCISASPHFAKMAIPLFLEKFSTSTGPTMKDLMLSIAACLPTYGAAAVQQRGNELWEGIKVEVLYSSDTSIEAAGYQALEALIATIYPTAQDVPSGLAQDVIKQCIEFMEDPEKSQAIAAVKALAAVVRASPSAGPYALSQVLPYLFTKFNRPAVPSSRGSILAAISSLLAAARSVYGAPKAKRHQSDERSLSPFRETLVDVLREGLRTEDLKLPAAKGTVSLVEIPGLIGRSEVEDLVRSLNDALLNDRDEQVRSSVVQSLLSISNSYSDIVESTTLPLLFHNLPDRAPSTSDSDTRDRYRRTLKSLTRLCVSPSFSETLFIRILTKLELLSTAPMIENSDGDDVMNGEDGVDERECNVAYSFELLMCLVEVVEEKIASKHAEIAKYFDKIIPRLHGLLVGAAAPRIGLSQPLFRNRRILSLVADLTETLTRELSIERQSKQFLDFYSAFEKGQIVTICHDPTQARGLNGSPLRHGAASAEGDLIALYASTVCSLKADAAAPYPSADAFFSSKIHWAVHEANNNWQLRFALWMITFFVNKREKELGDSLDSILEAVWVKEVVETSLPLETRCRALSVYLHTIKGLVVLRSSVAYAALERVIDVLKLSSFDPAFVNEAAASFGILSSTESRDKSREKHLSTKLLHAQKLWNYLLPRLIEGDQDAKGRDRLPYLVAISSLLPLVPASLYLSDFPRIFSLILRSLQLSEPRQRTNAVSALIAILETPNHSTAVDQILHERAGDMVTSLLQCSIRDGESSKSSGILRSTALRCLAMIPDVIRFDILRSQKAVVIRDLGRTLDDPVRAVRKEAVECRAKWFRYGAGA